jgi:hypothetical protein
MSTQNPDATSPAAAPVELSAEEKRAYVVKVIAKQAGVSHDIATVRASELSPEGAEAILAAGREGRVDDCRAILGL